MLQQHPDLLLALCAARRGRLHLLALCVASKGLLMHQQYRRTKRVVAHWTRTGAVLNAMHALTRVQATYAPPCHLRAVCSTHPARKRSESGVWSLDDGRKREVDVAGDGVGRTGDG